MSRSAITYPNPPLAGRPPFATNEPDSLYQTPPLRERMPMPAPENNVYDKYHNEGNRKSGFSAVGMGFLTGSMDDDDDDDDVPPYTQGPIGASVSLAAQKRPISQMSEERAPLTIVAPKPGYAAPIGALNITHPQPIASPLGRQPSQMSQYSFAPSATPRFPGSPQAAFMVPPSTPVTPLPLQPPLTPITPAFARPPKEAASRDVKFSSEPIMRGNSEDLLLPKRGDRGDDFWRRFSMVAKEDTQKRHEKSTWLTQTENGSSSLSRWVWITGIILLLLIGGGIGLGFYVSENDVSTTSSAPTAFGGSEEEGVSITSISTEAAVQQTATSSPYVSPTKTVNKRFFSPDSRATARPRKVKKAAFGHAHGIEISF